MKITQSLCGEDLCRLLGAHPSLANHDAPLPVTHHPADDDRINL
jgi:hypothetical protein